MQDFALGGKGVWQWLKHGQRKQGWVHPSVDRIEEAGRKQVDNGVPQQLNNGGKLVVAGSGVALGDLVCNGEENGKDGDNDARLGECGPEVLFRVQWRVGGVLVTL